MSLVPAFEIGVWNAWILIVLFLIANNGLTVLLVDRKSAWFAWPSYTKLEKRILAIGQVILFSSGIYSIFLPLKLGTAWFYAGFPIYLLGLAFITMAVLTFTATPVDKPNTTGIYRISRHPINFGWLLILLGVGIASASWVYLLVALTFLGMYITPLAIPEERMCCERFGDAYRDYMNRTPRWIGMPKSGAK